MKEEFGLKNFVTLIKSAKNVLFVFCFLVAFEIFSKSILPSALPENLYLKPALPPKISEHIRLLEVEHIKLEGEENFSPSIEIVQHQAQ